MRVSSVNLLQTLPEARDTEVVDELVVGRGMRLERIVSYGQASPPGFWYDQQQAEWVMVLSGSAGLLIEGRAEVTSLLRFD